jgi:hypothetical protein
MILALATWRLASLFSREEGPYRIFERFRHLIGVRFDQMSNPYGKNQLAEGILCLWCCSIWFATILSILAVICGTIESRDLLFNILAAGSGAIIIDEVLSWLERQP